MMFRCSSSSLLVGKNVVFTLQYDTKPGEVLYVAGTLPQLGQWDTSKAKRMVWNCGNIWDVEVGFPEGSRIEYKYFVLNEINRDVRWEAGRNREVVAEEDKTVLSDKWDNKNDVNAA